MSSSLQWKGGNLPHQRWSTFNGCWYVKERGRLRFDRFIQTLDEWWIVWLKVVVCQRHAQGQVTNQPTKPTKNGQSLSPTKIHKWNNNKDNNNIYSFWQFESVSIKLWSEQAVITLIIKQLKLIIIFYSKIQQNNFFYKFIQWYIIIMMIIIIIMIKIIGFDFISNQE